MKLERGPDQSHQTSMAVMKGPLSAALLLFGAASVGCNVTVDSHSEVQREEKRFTVTGTPDLRLTTFDGSIQIQSWDKPDVLVEIESSGFATGSRLRKERTLDAEELYATGFALAETHGAGRAIAEDVLAHLAKKQPRTKIGKAAKNKLELLSA